MTVSPQDVHRVLGNVILADGFDIVFDLEKSQGTYIYDAKTGKKYLDLFTFFASSPVGLNHPYLKSKSSQELFAKVAVNNVSNSDVYTTEMAEFVKAFREHAMPASYKYGFFVAGGSLAVENALKTAFDYKVQRNFAKAAKKEVGSQVVHFKNAFHGRSGYTLSLTNTLPDKIAHFPKFSWPRFETPALTFPLTSDLEKKVAAEEQRILNEIKHTAERIGDDIACLIIEPIQGEGGDVHFRKEFFQGLRKLCDQFDWLLIFDEVQTGFGLTGKMWVYQYFGVEPDIICFGKKAQVCGIICKDTIDRVATNVFHVSSRINSTWGGNITDMVRCRLYLEVYKEQKLIENADVQGQYLLKGLQEIGKEFNTIIHNVRGRGLMCSFSFYKPEQRNAFIKQMYKNYAIMLPCGFDAVRFRPPLTINSKEIDEALEKCRDSLKAV